MLTVDSPAFEEQMSVKAVANISYNKLMMKNKASAEEKLLLARSLWKCSLIFILFVAGESRLSPAERVQSNKKKSWVKATPHLQ
jgi:hypothetical protein